MNLSRERRGVVFFTTVILLSIVILVCSGLSIMLLRNIFNVNRIKYATQADFLAVAGVEEALKALSGSFDLPVVWKTNQPLGDIGTYTVSLQPHSTDPNRKLIKSTGTVKGISRSVTAQVSRVFTAGAFDYGALGGGKLTIAGGSVVDGTDVKVHSNSDAAGDAVSVGDKKTTGTVMGSVWACGGIKVDSDNGLVSVLPLHPNQSSLVYLPPFDDSFFQYYYNLALADNKTYSGNQTFEGDPLKDTTNHVAYVDGQVELKGTWTMTGCIVATQKIIINKKGSGHITQNQYHNLPAFMSRKDVEIYGPATINGLVYANGWIDINASSSTIINGALYGTIWVNLASETHLTYKKPNPPGMTSGTSSLRVESY